MATIIGEVLNARGEWVRGDFAAGEIWLEHDLLADDIPLLLDHDPDRRVGTVELVARKRNGTLIAVASLDQRVDLAPRPYLSIAAAGLRRSTTLMVLAEIFEVSLVERTASIGVSRVHWHHHDLRHGVGGWSIGTGQAERDLLNRAAVDYADRRWSRRPRTILDLDAEDHVALGPGVPAG